MTNVKHLDRPKCHVKGCTRKAQHTGYILKNGNIRWRKGWGPDGTYGYLCRQHHHEDIGWGSGKYTKHKKNYCENIDGRLGFECIATIMGNHMLDVDHIDGNPSNNDIDNLQTLCKNCHAHKSLINEDSLSPGRKKLGLKH